MGMGADETWNDKAAASIDDVIGRTTPASADMNNTIVSVSDTAILNYPVVYAVMSDNP
jgi:hypothetical protein